jgi:CBS domain-containing protein
MKRAAAIRPACCAPDTPLGAVARLMVQHNCGQVPLVDVDGQLIGVVADRDIVCRVAFISRVFQRGNLDALLTSVRQLRDELIERGQRAS